MKNLIYITFIAAGFSACTKKLPAVPGTQITIAGLRERDAGHGIFDASLAQDTSTSRLWMSYSATQLPHRWTVQFPWIVNTRLAYSDDSGSHFTDLGRTVNAATEVQAKNTYNMPGASAWQNETSSLLYDPTPVSSDQKWKLLWHHYFSNNGGQGWENNWLALKMADSPEKLPDAQEIKVFVGNGYNSTAESTTSDIQTPVGGPPAVHLNQLDADIAQCHFAEPSLYSNGKAIYLSLTCLNLEAPPFSGRIVLFRCESPCNVTDPSQWSYRGTVLSAADGQALGGAEGVIADEIRESNGSVYILATLLQKDFSYRSCKVFRFSDIDSAQIEKSNGAPKAVLSVDGVPDLHNGACTYFSTASGTGVIFEELYPDAFDLFRLYASHTMLP